MPEPPRSVNPIPTSAVEGGQILPTVYCWYPQNFSPSAGISSSIIHGFKLNLGTKYVDIYL